MKIHQLPIRKARIEIIPMIDTIFFLLVFFMVTSLSMVKMKGISMALPRSGSASSSTGAVTSRPPTAILTVTASGEYYVNTARISPADLARALADRLNRNPATVVVLNLAKTQNTQTLIHIMDTLSQIKGPGGQRVKALLATEPVDMHGRALRPNSDAGSQK